MSIDIPGRPDRYTGRAAPEGRQPAANEVEATEARFRGERRKEYERQLREQQQVIRHHRWPLTND